MYTNETRIIDLTVGELKGLFAQLLLQQKQPEPKAHREMVYGYEGLSALLGCSLSTATRKVASGKYKSATYRDGRKIMFDKEQVLQILNKH